jgi:type I restriction enzyme S subunit
MQSLLTGQQRLPGFNAEWRSVPLGELIAHCSSGATPYRRRSDYYSGTVKWITSGELNYNVITETIEHISEDAVRDTNLKVHPPGIFLMAITGLEAAGTRGSCGVVGAQATTNQSCMAIYPSPSLKTDFLYHYYVFRGNQLALQYCQGTKQQSYTAKLVKLLPIDVPPMVDEQTAIAAVLSDMDAEIAALETRLAKTRELKQGMMQALLTGRIRLISAASRVVEFKGKQKSRTSKGVPHNKHFNEAIVIGVLARHFGSEEFPLGRFRRTKFAYLLHRHSEGRADGFMKKAAGPYDPNTRYGGAETIALKNGYAKKHRSGSREGFIAGDHIAEAESYFHKWYGAAVLKWLERFRTKNNDELELLTTVDVAAVELKNTGKPVNVANVKCVLLGHSEWRSKLDRPIFSDSNLSRAINTCRALFVEER